MITVKRLEVSLYERIVGEEVVEMEKKDVIR
jgi:hypothetical protein